ncbi:MAG TPA: ATP-binding protein, partial [Chthoniobacteraceae bacterium]|nr:ATP-binding protein [Chthoniobacteraceae bacterium]
ESLGIAAGGIAHDFNNLLTGIIGNLSLSLMTCDPEDDMHDRLSTAKKASIRAQELAQQLLTFAKGGAPVKKTSSIGQLIEETVNFTITGTNVLKEIRIPATLWPVDIDSGQISQVVANLVLNAEQAMPAGGTVRVCSENFTLAQEDATLSYLRPGRFVKITVQDEGIGIPQEYIKKIFDPYFTTKPKGSGLGLATAYSIIKSHDGMITVDSAAGTGSTFSIYLPASDKEVVGDKPNTQTPLTGSGKILIMDDEEVICELVNHTLSPIGYAVTETRDAASCVRQYAEAMLSGHPFDAVIMDLTIPGGVGGREAVKQLLEIDPNVRAIVSSGYATDPVMSRHREYGFCAMLAKPYEISDLAKIVHEVVGAKGEALVYHDFAHMQTA